MSKAGPIPIQLEIHQFNTEFIWHIYIFLFFRTILILVKVLPVGPLCTGCHKYAVCVDGKCACKAGYLGNGNVCEGIYDSCSLPKSC